MRKRIPIKNHQREIQLIVHRSMVGFIFMLILVVILILRLAYLQIYKNETYNTLSTQNWLDLVPIEPTRGLIYDRNGVLLAENIPVFSLDVIPVQVKDLNAALKAVNEIVSISENDISQFKKQLKQHRRFDEIPLKLRLSDEEVAQFTENQYRFPGFFIKARLIRHYPQMETFSHVVGYVGRINALELSEIDPINYSASYYIGKLGIEKSYEKELHGQVGYQQVENDAKGKPIRILKEIKSIPGKNIYLTIDSGLQIIADRALGNLRGAVVAIEPATGQVLAMISKPGYDPNLFVLGLNQKDYQQLQQSENRPLFNRALRGLYPPASTIKPFLALGGLDNDIITPEYQILDSGWFQLHNNSHRYHDWTAQGHGRVNVNKAIVSSCDVYFYELASKMGIELFDQVLGQFGFGKLTGLDIDEELPSVLASPEVKLQTQGFNWYEGDTILAGIGQGLMQTTPLQLAVATATLANRGERFLPYLLLGYQQPGTVFQTQNPTPLPPVALKNIEHWQTIIKAMQNVITTRAGTGYMFGKNIGYTLAAKTGTGQVISKRMYGNEVSNQEDLPEKLRDHHLFIAFAPIDQPKIAVAVVTENSNSAAKTARVILDYYMGRERLSKPAPQKQSVGAGSLGSNQHAN